MIKICFIVTVYKTYHYFLKKYVDFLHETGKYEISLICAQEAETQNDIQNFVHLHMIPMHRGMDLAAFRAILLMKQLMQKEKFDIIQYSTPNASFYGAIAGSWAKIPKRLYCQWGIRYMGLSGFNRLLFRLLEKITCKLSTHIQVESDGIRDYAITEGLYRADKSLVIGKGSACGVDLTKFDFSHRNIWRQKIREKYQIDKDMVVYIYAARLTADKGINELLSAFMRLAAVHRNYYLFICGGIDNAGSLCKELWTQAIKSKQIVFTGNVDNLEAYYAASDIFVSPSYREGFGLVIIEAGAMGIPAVVSDVPGQIDAIIPEQTGILCKVRNSEDLKMNMERLGENRLLRQKLSYNAGQYVRDNFNQIKIFELLEKRLEVLCRK